MARCSIHLEGQEGDHTLTNQVSLLKATIVAHAVTRGVELKELYYGILQYIN
jgi:hypothetical protein